VRFVAPEPTAPRYRQAEIDSPAMAVALDAVGARTGLDSSTLLLGIFAVALERVTGVNPVVVRPVVSNRFRPGLAGVVCTAAQGGLCVIDVAGVGFDEAMARAHRAKTSAFKYGYFHPGDLNDLRARVESERGPVEIGCYFNDRRSAAGRVAGAAAAGETRFRWVGGTPCGPLEFQVEDVGGTVAMTARLDSHHLSPAGGEALLRGMEAVAREAAAPNGGSRSVRLP
jgi:hypothetical protein